MPNRRNWFGTQTGKEGNITFETNDMQQRREIVAAAVINTRFM